MSIDRLTDYALESFDSGPDPYALAGVLFADNFDSMFASDSAAAGIAAAADPVALCDEDIKSAWRDGYAEGVQAGRADADSRARIAQESAAQALSNALNAAHDAAGRATQDAAAKLAQTVLDALALLLPELRDRYGAAEAEALIGELLPMLAQQTRLILRANPQTLEDLKLIAQPHSGVPHARMNLIADTTLGLGDFSLQWDSGEVRRSVDHLLPQLRDLLCNPRAMAPPSVSSSASAWTRITNDKEYADAR